MAYTLSQVQSYYDAAAAAYVKALKAQEYTHGGSQVSFSKKNQDVKDLKAEMDMWQNEIDRLTQGGGILESQISLGYDR